MGLLWGAILVRGGAEVYMVTRRKEQAEQLNEAGIELLEGTQHTRWSVYASSTGSAPVEVDAVMITVKQFDLVAAYPTIRDWVQGGPLLLGLQNGWGHEDWLAERFPTLPLALAVTTEGARMEGEATVRSTGKGSTWLGLSPFTLQELEESAKVKLDKLRNYLLHGGMEALSTEYIRDFMWKKLVINSIINPLTALWEIRNGELLESEERLADMRSLFNEAITLSQAEKRNISAHELWESILTVCRQTAANRSSMLQDLDAGRSTEVDSINGTMLRLAHQHGIRLPYHRLMLELIYKKEGRERSEGC